MNWILATIICVVAAVLEGVGGGSDVKGRLASLRMPRVAPPFWLWIAIGGLYYVTCFILLARILAATPVHAAALIAVLLLMILNTLWTFRFFRSRDLSGSLLIGALYLPLAIVLFVLLYGRDRTSAYLFLPYFIYLSYGTWWTFAVWKNNRPAAE